MKDILKGGHKDIIVYLLGNKVDLIEKRKIYHETGLNFAKERNIKFTEINSKLYLNIEDIVYFIIYDTLKTENYNYSQKSKNFSLGKQRFKSNNKSYHNNKHENNKRNNNSILKIVAAFNYNKIL